MFTGRVPMRRRIVGGTAKVIDSKPLEQGSAGKCRRPGSGRSAFVKNVCHAAVSCGDRRDCRR